MSVGIARTNFAGNVSDPWLFAREAERLGFDSIWAGEHIVSPKVTAEGHAYHGESVPLMPSSIVRLAGVAAATRTIGIGTSIILLPQHNPLMLAKQLATLDADSVGRLSVGIGIGWNREEMEILGGNFDRRVAQTMEALEVLKLLWTGEFVSFEGEFYNFPPLKSAPPPLQKPHPPILFGMNGAKAISRVVDHADGWLPSVYKPEEVKGTGIDRIAKGREEIERLCAERGRDPETISITVVLADTPDQPVDRTLIDKYKAAGASSVVLLQSREAYTQFADEKEAVAYLESVADRAFG